MLLNLVLFEGTDASDHVGLWETNGTVSGTFELAPIAGTYAGPATPIGLSPSNLTNFNDEVLFEGVNTSRQFGLWVSNGVAAGTMELTGIVGENSSGLNPTGLTVFNNEVLFNGKDSTGPGLLGLWVTTGTSAGTHEITGIGGGCLDGIRPIGSHSLQQ
jgi:hypothetical protein